MRLEEFWYSFKTLLSKTGYLKKEDMYKAYIAAYTYYLASNETETWDRFLSICNNVGYQPDEWVEYTFKTLKENNKNINSGFSKIFGIALQYDKINI